jgi:hypothetical protein
MDPRDVEERHDTQETKGKERSPILCSGGRDHEIWKRFG